MILRIFKESFSYFQAIKNLGIIKMKNKSKPYQHILVLARDLVPGPLGSHIDQREKILVTISNLKVKKSSLKVK